MSYINRGNRTRRRRRRPEDYADAQTERNLAADRRRDHFYIGVICPACGTPQRIEIPLPGGAIPTADDYAARRPLPVPDYLQVHCVVGQRADDRLRWVRYRLRNGYADDGTPLPLPPLCSTRLRVALDGADAVTISSGPYKGWPWALAWAHWTREHRYPWERQRDLKLTIEDGFRTSPDRWPNLPVPDHVGWNAAAYPEPPYAQYRPGRGFVAVRLLEDPTVRDPSVVDYNLPRGRYIRVDVLAGYQKVSREDGNPLRYAELLVPMPIDDEIRQELLEELVEDPEEREYFHRTREAMRIQAPWGLEAWSWSARGQQRRVAGDEVGASPVAAARPVEDYPLPAEDAAEAVPEEETTDPRVVDLPLEPMVTEDAEEAQRAAEDALPAGVVHSDDQEGGFYAADVDDEEDADLPAERRPWWSRIFGN